MDLGAFSSFLAALLLGHMAGVPADASWQRHVSIVGAAVNALILMGSPGFFPSNTLYTYQTRANSLPYSYYPIAYLTFMPLYSAPNPIHLPSSLSVTCLLCLFGASQPLLPYYSTHDGRVTHCAHRNNHTSFPTPTQPVHQALIRIEPLVYCRVGIETTGGTAA